MGFHDNLYLRNLPTWYILGKNSVLFVRGTFLSSCIEGTSKLKDGLPEKCQITCYCAISQFDEVYSKLETRSITVADLQKIKENMEQMERLCRSASTQQMSTGTSVDEPTEVTFEARKAVISLRIKELNIFKNQQHILLELCQKIPDHVKGMYICNHRVGRLYK